MRPDRRRAMLHRLSSEDPVLAARLILMTLPAAAARLPGPLAFVLDVEGVGPQRVSVSGGRAKVVPAAGEDGRADADFVLQADPAALVELVTGTAGPLGLMMRGRLRIRGKRRKALALRNLGDGDLGMADVVEAGGSLEPDVLYRALPAMVDPEWTTGEEFTVRYAVTGERGGEWYVHVRDGEPLQVTTELPESRDLAASVRLSSETYAAMAAGRLSPSRAMQEQLTVVEGRIHPVTLLGRWISRAQGADDEEMAREERQREVQVRRAGMYAADGAGPGQGDPGHRAGPDGHELLDYRRLYALWERQNWRATDLDFSVDRQHWVTAPAEAQESTTWSLGAFYVGEERVTADLAPFLLAAPTGEIELFLATQLVDEARHAAFFDRFGAEVMCLGAEDLRGRIEEVEGVLLSPWREVFDDGLRDVAHRIQRSPDDLDLFVEGVTTYHMIVEGFLAVTGQTLIREYMSEHSMYPGFCRGFELVERDEHRHIAFGVRFLRDAIEEDPRHRATVERVVLDLVPKAAYVFVPPYAPDAREYVSYGYSSRETYGFAYRTLKRRMRVLGIDIPPPEELMPGPVDQVDAGQRQAAGANGAGAADAAPAT